MDALTIDELISLLQKERESVGGDTPVHVDFRGKSNVLDGRVLGCRHEYDFPDAGCVSCVIHAVEG